MDYHLVKFTNYGEDFLKGKLYLNSLEYYRGVEEILNGNIKERNEAINDFLEGSVASVNKYELTKYGISFGEEIVDALVGNVHFLSEDLKFLKLMCLYTFLFDKKKKIVVVPHKNLYQFESKDAVIIYNKSEFNKRIINSLKKKTTNIVAYKGGFVNYYDNDRQTKWLGPFDKIADFWWQQEFRLMFIEEPTNLEPTILDIGNISDIAICISTKELIEHPEKYYID